MAAIPETGIDREANEGVHQSRSREPGAARTQMSSINRFMDHFEMQLQKSTFSLLHSGLFNYVTSYFVIQLVI